MKKTILFISISTILFFNSCKNASKESNNTNDSNQTNTEQLTKKYNINNQVSTIEWKCGKLIGGEHIGNISFVNGIIEGTDAHLVSGKMDIDMKSITNKDIADKGKNSDLINHLKSPDFFDTEKFPTSTIEIIKIEDTKDLAASTNTNITAKLTIKGVMKEITFPALIKYADLGFSANADIKINRKEWGMNYGTEGSVADLAKDRIINNDIFFKVSILAEEVK